jgi:hypothetical protein
VHLLAVIVVNGVVTRGNTRKAILASNAAFRYRPDDPSSEELGLHQRRHPSESSTSADSACIKRMTEVAITIDGWTVCLCIPPSVTDVS